MVKFSKDNIRGMLKIKSFREYFEKLLPNLNANENFQLGRLLAEK
jgi:aminopeptidase N